MNTVEREYDKRVLYLHGLNELKQRDIRISPTRYKNKFSDFRKYSNYLFHSGYGLHEKGLNGSRSKCVKRRKHHILTTLTVFGIGAIFLKVMKNSKK